MTVEEYFASLEQLGWSFVEKGGKARAIMPSIEYEPETLELQALKEMHGLDESIDPMPLRYDPTLGQWNTPPKLALTVARWMALHGSDVVDPCAGTGELVAAALKAGARHALAIEKDQRLYEYLLGRFAGDQRVEVICSDFLAEFGESLEGYQAFMNPPYEDDGEAHFVARAHDLGCKLVTSITRSNALHGRRRWDIEWHRSQIVRGARLVSRPSFNGEVTGGRFDTIVTTRERLSDTVERVETWDDWEEDSWK